MDNPNKESETTLKTEEQISQSEETEKEKNGESEEKETGKTSKYDFLEEGEEETQKEEKKEEKPEEKKKDEVIDDEEIIYEDDKITFKKGEEKKELVKVDLGDGSFAYAPLDKKDGYLRQADYTKKTMALSEDRKTFESIKAQVEAEKQIIEAEKFIDILGKQPDKPQLKDFTQSDGKYYLKFDSEEAAIEGYEKAREQYEENYPKWLSAKTNLDNIIASVKASNNKMIADFTEKYGKETADEVINTASQYINPLVFKEVVPYPSDALEIIRKGLNYDKDIAEAVKKAKEKLINDTNDKKGKKIILKQSHNPALNDDKPKGRYDFVNEE